MTDDKRSEDQFKSHYPAGSERDIRYRFFMGDPTASPTLSDGSRMTAESHPNMFGSGARNKKKGKK